MESWILVALLAALGLGGGATAASSRWIEARTRGRIVGSLDELPRAACVVVLGCPPQRADGRPNPLLVARVAAAAAAYHASPDSRTLLCSGRRDGDGPHEAEALAEALAHARVPQDAIALDREAPRTIDTIANVARCRPDAPIVLVTQHFHLPRSLFLARRAGLDAIGLPAAGPEPGRRLHGREALARLWAVVESRRLVGARGMLRSEGDGEADR